MAPLLHRGAQADVTVRYWEKGSRHVRMLKLVAVAIAMAGQLIATGASAQQAAAPAQSVSAMQDYQLGAADRLRILVYNEPTLSGEFTVNSNGMVAVPLIGDVSAMGKTTRQFTDEVQRRFSDGYLRDPKISIDVVNFRPFYILGEVGKPGEYSYSAGLTVMNAVATAQGFTYRAEKRRVYIKSVGQDQEVLEKLTPGLMVKPGDTIRVGERYF